MSRHAIHLEKAIDELKHLILSLGSDVEESVRLSVQSLDQRKPEQAKEVIAADYAIDQREVYIEEECLKILALHQPVANDLRLIIAILKINNDLERIADLSVNIAKRAVYLSGEAKVDLPFDLQKMAEKVQSMLKRSLDAMVNRDEKLARRVCEDDDEVDAMNREMYVCVEQAIKKDIENLNSYIQLLSASRYLERMADHTTNIAEDVIYLVTGEIIRHGNPA
ncbi:MAG: phosphate signaling complex protein PhoU [Nitrospina sp.]|jgi:phosphate transport system protein|nr:phosphate signaling complex protein PhoU [Nitrospina sp.]MBT3415679.1 phosphate signaling complex protein PhoU [Nitrospina sp.]MBT3855597.1 phosphate signaling complex protein PhoU [Nitrospina sp.]MBT4104680.1 phosphate signaling complex protein PhoU [Nitrospina sp.]MBT4390081.1 phosphate signaling complex protein PhoU [Nitrospina sp.]